MMSPKAEQEFIQVAVPAQHVMAVYRLLSELEQEPDATTDALGVWDADKLARLASTNLNTTKTVTRILDVLCLEPGKQYDMQDLVNALSMEYHSLRGNLAAFTRHLNTHYDSDTWPMRVDESSGGAMLYSLDAATAALWKSVRG
ncbi:hypothetical protein ACFYYL_43015 [Actinomadura geliboluensis]|uniref:hypothetical protein n=1 Tax=Actinomadura geliboluensis TaxID=882440 RepID=UPI0036ACD41E